MSLPAVSPRPRKTAARWTRRTGGALFISAVAHAAVAVTAGAVLSSALGRPAGGREAVDVDVVPLLVGEARPVSGGVVQASATKHRPAYRRAAATKRSPAPAGATELTASVADDEAEPARFALSAGTVATRPSAGATGSASGSGLDASHDGDPLSEGEASVPARVLASSPLVYPAAARKAELELDLPLEIVVDASGRVRSARGITHAGYGLDEAALEAIRRYRFSPALRDGRPVPVRMRWTMQFRLR